MPFEVIDTTTDAITEMLRFQASPVYEMIISPQVLLKPGRHADRVAAVRLDLPPGLMDELAEVYGPFMGGSIFFELPVDYADHEDVPGFIQYVREMDPIDFIFYLTGRVLTPEEILATGPAFKPMIAAIMATPYSVHCGCTEDAFDEMILKDVPAFQHRLADVWERYWESFLKYRIAGIRPHWEAAIEDKTDLLKRAGGQYVYEHVLGREKPLPTLPPGHPVTDVLFIPLYLLPSPVYMLYGYGNVTVLFDSERTEARLAEMQQHKENLLSALKALSDSSRLDILRLVTQYEGGMNGKKIAEFLNLSAPTVSRHLTQMRDAGLIVEESQDNRTITYRLQTDAIQALPKQLLDYLHH
jgi:DNA-binding transcriptional ArsR family regulator